MEFDKKLIFCLVQALLEALSIIMIVGVFSKYDKGQYTIKFKGYNLMFGKSELEYQWLKPSPGGIITFILMFLAFFASISKIFLEQFKKYINFSIMGISIIASIFLLCASTNFWVDIKNAEYKDYKKYMKLQYGAFIDLACNIVICACSAIDEFVFK